MAVAEADATVEIVSADSMQVYRGMDIGTAKPTAAEQAAVPHHLVDVVEPSADYTVSEFANAAEQVIEAAVDRGATPVLVGGTGLYVRSVVDDFEIPGRYLDVRRELETEPDTQALYDRLVQSDHVAAGRIEPGNRRRVVRALEVTIGSGRPFSSWGPGMDHYPTIATRQIACDRPRSSLDQRIEARYRIQMEAGFLDEVAGLVTDGRVVSRTARQALGYRELLGHLEDGEPIDEMLALANQRTRRFARRQQKWFRRDPRTEWVDLDEVNLDQVVADVVVGLASWRSQRS